MDLLLVQWLLIPLAHPIFCQVALSLQMVTSVEVGWSVSHCCLWAVGLGKTCAYQLHWRCLENWLSCTKVSLFVAGMLFFVEILCSSLVLWGVLPFGCTPCVVHLWCVMCVRLYHHPLIHLYCERSWVLSDWWCLCAVWRGNQWLHVMVFGNKHDGFDLLPIGRDGHCELSHEWQ